MDSFLLSILTCPRGCGTTLEIAKAGTDESLQCPRCFAVYPVISGVPVLFVDEGRVRLTLDKSLQTKRIHEVETSYSHRVGQCALSGDCMLDEALVWECYLSQTWATHIGKGHREFFETAAAREKPLKGKVVLNVGCGADPILELFKQAGATIVEQDVVLDGPVQLAARGASGICCDLRSLPIRSGVVDLVTSYLVIHHVWPIEQPLAEMWRVLGDGVALFIREANDIALTSGVRRNLSPKLVKLIMRVLTRDDYRESPFEKFVNPYRLVDCLKNFSSVSGTELSFTKGASSKVIGASVTSLLIYLIPSLSASFDVYARKGHAHESNHYR